MAKDSRQNDRVNAMLPVRFEEGGVGVTRNLSPGGVYFIVDESVTAGHPVRFSLEFTSGDTASAELYLECVGHVVRVEPVGGKLGVAVQLTESRLERRRITDVRKKGVGS
jgi:hypothetical protein